MWIHQSPDNDVSQYKYLLVTALLFSRTKKFQPLKIFSSRRILWPITSSWPSTVIHIQHSFVLAAKVVSAPSAGNCRLVLPVDLVVFSSPLAPSTKFVEVSSLHFPTSPLPSTLIRQLGFPSLKSSQVQTYFNTPGKLVVLQAKILFIKSGCVVFKLCF